MSREWHMGILTSKSTQKLTNDGDIVAGSLELPQGNIDGDTALTLGLQFVQNPRILEGTLAKFGGFLKEGSVIVSIQKRSGV